MNLIIKSLNFSYQSEEVFKDLNLNFNSGILNLVSGPIRFWKNYIVKSNRWIRKTLIWSNNA